MGPAFGAAPPFARYGRLSPRRNDGLVAWLVLAGEFSERGAYTIALRAAAVAVAAATAVALSLQLAVPPVTAATAAAVRAASDGRPVFWLVGVGCELHARET